MPNFDSYNQPVSPWPWSDVQYQIVYPGQEGASGSPGYADPFAPTEEMPVAPGAGQIPAAQQGQVAIRRDARYPQPTNGQERPGPIQHRYRPGAPIWPDAREAHAIPEVSAKTWLSGPLGKLGIAAALVVTVGGGLVGINAVRNSNTSPRTANTWQQPASFGEPDRISVTATPQKTPAPKATSTPIPKTPKTPPSPPTPDNTPKGMRPEYLPNGAHVYSSPGGSELGTSNDIPAGATVYVACSIKVNGVEWYQLSDTGNWVPASAFANKNDSGLPTCP